MIKRGFTISEMLIVMVIIGIISAATIPMFTIKKKMKDFEISSIICVRKEQAATVTFPATTPSTACAAAISKAQFGKESAINTLAFLMSNGKSAAEKTAARKVLRTACDNGGDKACGYFVTACQKNSTLCDTGGLYDLRHYLELDPVINNHAGDSAKFLMYDAAKPLYDSNNTNIKNIVNQYCCNNGIINMACYIKGQTECPNAYGWGYNGAIDYGAIGDNTITSRKIPTATFGPDGTLASAFVFSQISAGNRFSCGIEKTTGKVYCWGNNDYGKIGDNSTTNNKIPTAVVGPDGLLSSALIFYQISAGTFHTCGIEKTTNKAYCWGYNAFGQIGDNTTTDRKVPTAVVGPDGLLSSAFTYSQISTGELHTCGIEKTTNKAYCWGENGNGPIGDNTNTHRKVPTAVVGPDGLLSSAFTYSQIDAGYFKNCGIEKTTNKAYCWGFNGNGSIGDNTNTARKVPTAVLGSDGLLSSAFTYFQIDTGWNHTCGIEKTTNKAYCWGTNTNAAIGDNTTVQRQVPTAVVGLDGLLSSALTYSQIDVADDGGQTGACGIEKTTGKAYCWGYNSSGEVGDNTTTQRKVPTAVLGPDGLSSSAFTFSQISRGNFHVLGLKR